MPNAVLARLVSEREGLLEQADAVTSAAEDDERDLTDAEVELIRRHRERADALDPQIAELLELEEARGRSQAARAAIHSAAPPRTRETPRPADEDVVYRTWAEYARDWLVTRVPQIGAVAGAELRTRAAERLERAPVHTLTSDVPGLLMPQHIAQIFEVINTARPVVSSSRNIGLTSGSLTWPSVTGRPAVAKQAAEKTEAAYGKMTVSMLTKVADVYLGAGNLSWQTIQWSSPDALTLFFDLMAEAYAEQTESAACTVLDAAAAANATIPVASDDLAGWLAAVAAAAGIVRAAGGRANSIYLDAETGYGLLGMVAAVNPVFLSAGPGSLGDASGNLGGLSFVVSDGFAPDTAIVGDSSKMLCAETSGAPVEMRAVEPSIGGLEVGVIGAFAASPMLPGCFVTLTPPAGP